MLFPANYVNSQLQCPILKIEFIANDKLGPMGERFQLIKGKKLNAVF